MRITIDYTPAIHQRAGIGRYTRGLVSALAKLAPQHQFKLLVLGKPSPDFVAPNLPPNFRMRTVPITDRCATVIWYRMNLPLPVEILAGGADLFHGPSFTLPPSFAQSLLTVHDLSFLRYPEGAFPPLLKWLSKAVPRSLARACHVLADSENTRRDLVELMGLSGDAITVIGAGVDPSFTPITNPDRLAAVRRRYGLPAHFVLGMSTLEPRKNFTGLIAAFEQLAAAHPGAADDLHLVIAGGKGWLYQPIFAAAAASPLRQRIHFPGFIADDDLPALYSLARVFAFPSHYEGFGIPVLEAMACGTPVVCADNSSLPEVAGDAALLVDSRDTEKLADALAQLLTDVNLRQMLTKRGHLQAQRFDWSDAAQRLLAVYEAIGANKPIALS